jgi:2-keto-4-pentenoate hydratase/2-oxohepta-3-ene-1,7-dioic acid hydratase in catechol pathway
MISPSGIRSLARPEQPLVFAKFPSSVTGPNDPIVVDSELTKQVDWEVELGVIVGRRDAQRRG